MPFCNLTQGEQRENLIGRDGCDQGDLEWFGRGVGGDFWDKIGWVCKILGD